MDTTVLKGFATAARLQLLRDVGSRLDVVLDPASTERRESAGAVARLEDALSVEGRQAVVDRVAYTWFNRIVALRFMDANGYNPVNVVSAAAGQSLGQPEVLADAKSGHVDADILGGAAGRVMDLLTGRVSSPDPQQEAYRLLLIGYCNQLHDPMPFMFERIGDETELLMPADLLSDNSIINKTVATLTADACADVEVIGWLYQFYISDRKDEVIGKVVKSEDIPAATQLFTPNWIVKYMVQNSLGAQWLATYPDSPLKGQMEYYIEPAEQTDEVNAQLAAITPSQLNPEELTLIDPASGSGHILVEAYELFKAIYLERGYQGAQIPGLILEKNLFGLDIDQRAAQLTAFALMMKARADDKRLFTRGINLNVACLENSTNLDVRAIADSIRLADYNLDIDDLTEFKDLFEHATTFGSLIRIPSHLIDKIPALAELSQSSGKDLLASNALQQLTPLVNQADYLANQYDNVVANPPYMGSKFHPETLRLYLSDQFDGYEKDVFSAFIARNLTMTKPDGHVGFMSPFVWMFLSSHENLRTRLVDEVTITSLIQLEYSGFDGATVPVCTFTVRKSHIVGERGCYIRLSDFRGSKNQAPRTLEAIQNRACGWFYEAAQDEFKEIPGIPIAYWVSSEVRDAFRSMPALSTVLSLKAGLSTGNNDLFQRLWHEVSFRRISFSYPTHKARWVPCNSGGEFRKWFGNNTFVVDWANEGSAMRSYRNAQGKIGSAIRNEDFYFREGITWNKISSGRFAARWMDQGYAFDDTGRSGFPVSSEIRTENVLAAMLSNLANAALGILAPSLSFTSGELEKVPIPCLKEAEVGNAAATAIDIARWDWDLSERSWSFTQHPLVAGRQSVLAESASAFMVTASATTQKLQMLERLINSDINRAAGLSDETFNDVPIEQVTLTVNPAYRYGGKLTEEEQWTRFRQDTMQELVSYAVGCMMGRYSLDEPGLILANQGDGVAEYLSRVPEPSFMPDEDNVIPILGDEWFADDIVGRFRAFLKTAFGADHFEENLRFVEDGLGKPIRKYFVTDFYKDHVQVYKKRPVYWMFSSPKGSFNALIYLHRYQPDTASVVLNKYLREFQAKLHARLDTLAATEISVSASTKEKTAARKEADHTRQIITELADYERDTLYPLATQQINIDLDDGVKANYPKFGPALKKIPGLST